jgi:exodeoxyribonuclease V alpha subunit
MSAWKEWASSGAFSPLDLRFAEFLGAMSESAIAPVVSLSAALVSRERSLGHSCVALEEWAGASLRSDGKGTPLPGQSEWMDALDKVPDLVGDGGVPAPLVRDGSGFLYLYRYWKAERFLIEAVKTRLRASSPVPDPASMAPLFRKLFPPPEDGETDGQAQAAASALRHLFAVVTGGPGTGKTTTVARILALLYHQDPDGLLALASPTGKGAARLTESILREAGRLPIDESLRDRLLASKAGTLHRILGYNPSTETFRYGPEHRLPIRTIVVDEASMVDLLLMDALFQALPEDGRVILLGDKDQLASVETGYVLGDLCRASRTESPVSEAFASFFRTLSNQPLQGTRKRVSPLRDAVTELTKNYRYPKFPGIGVLARAVNAGDPDRTIEVLEDARFPEVSLAPHPEKAVDLLSPILGELEAWAKASTPEEALDRLRDFQILCATRRGRWSVDHGNKIVEAWLRRRGCSLSGTWYRGRPVMVTENDYHVRLFNGDLGVCWPDKGANWAWFPDEEDKPRRVPLSKLPGHETAFAMTVHKSQGSEYRKVLLVTPASDAPILSREHLYTGITRAREVVALCAGEEILREAVRRSASRKSGLAEAIRV